MKLCCPGAMTRRWAPTTRYTLRRNTASIMKDLIWFALFFWTFFNVTWFFNGYFLFNLFAVVYTVFISCSELREHFRLIIRAAEAGDKKQQLNCFGIGKQLGFSRGATLFELQTKIHRMCFWLVILQLHNYHFCTFFFIFCTLQFRLD